MRSKDDVVKEFGNYFRVSERFVVDEPFGVCSACGALTTYLYKPIITDKLAKEWGLTKAEQKAFSARESMFCQFCGCSYRLRALARALSLYAVPGTDQCLKELIAKGAFKDLRIAEINSCGVLHDIIKDVPHLWYSEYGSTNPDIPSEDLSALSYTDGSFDIVLDSDTLEHVPDPALSLKEIRRVLKPDGAHIFTVPLRLTRKTVTRTKLAGRKKVAVKAPSFHGSGEADYLVWSEFGWDFFGVVGSVYAGSSAYFINPLNLSDPSFVLVATAEAQGKKTVIESSYLSPSAQKQFARKLPSAVLLEPLAFSQEVQRQRTNQLVRKLELTIQHAQTLEALLADREAYIEKLQVDIREVSSELDRLQHMPLVRAARKISRPKKH